MRKDDLYKKKKKKRLEALTTAFAICFNLSYSISLVRPYRGTLFYHQCSTCSFPSNVLFFMLDFRQQKMCFTFKPRKIIALYFTMFINHNGQVKTVPYIIVTKLNVIELTELIDFDGFMTHALSKMFIFGFCAISILKRN